MLASKILKSGAHKTSRSVQVLDAGFKKIRRGYMWVLGKSLRRPAYVAVVLVLLMGLSGFIILRVPAEYTPREDRGAFNIMVNGPEGASFAYMKTYMDEIERRLMPYTQGGEFKTMLVRSPRGFGGGASFNTGMVIVVLQDWAERRPAEAIMAEVRAKLSDLPGVRISVVMRQGFTSSSSRPIQFVIGGGTYAELAAWRDILLEKINEKNPGLLNVDWNYKETKPQFEVAIDYDRAAELGVTVADIGRTLETMMGSRRVTTYIDAGEEYDVILEGERDAQRTRTSLENIYVRSSRSDALIPLSASMNWPTPRR
jgi:multidrug efflux pump